MAGVHRMTQPHADITARRCGRCCTHPHRWTALPVVSPRSKQGRSPSAAVLTGKVVEQRSLCWPRAAEVRAAVAAGAAACGRRTAGGGEGRGAGCGGGHSAQGGLLTPCSWQTCSSAAIRSGVCERGARLSVAMTTPASMQWDCTAAEIRVTACRSCRRNRRPGRRRR